MSPFIKHNETAHRPSAQDGDEMTRLEAMRELLADRPLEYEDEHDGGAGVVWGMIGVALAVLAVFALTIWWGRP